MIPTTTSITTTLPRPPLYPNDAVDETNAADHNPIMTTSTTRKRCQAELQQRLTHIDTTAMAASSSSSSSSSSCSSSLSGSSSLLDFQSLQSSLKRVRLSQSPGELRLERDLRNLVTSEGWNKVEQHVYLFGGDKSSTLEQTPGDPLRLILLTHQISVFLQIPRRYPHRPPVVSRVIYPACAQRSTMNSTTTTTWLAASSTETSSAAVASSTTRLSPPQQEQQRRRIERILVHEAPPISTAGTDYSMLDFTTLSPTAAASTFHLNPMAETTVIYNEWSPVKRLGDLLRFIVNVFEPKHEKEEEEGNEEERQDYEAGCYLQSRKGCCSEESLTMSWDGSESPTQQQQPLRHFHHHGHAVATSQSLRNSHHHQDHRFLQVDEENSEQQQHRINQEQHLVDQLAASLKSSSMDGSFAPTTTVGNNNALTMNSNNNGTTASSFFVEEHKSMNEMEYVELDSSSSVSSNCNSDMTTVRTNNTVLSPLPFPPNRFDVGYDKATNGSADDDEFLTDPVSSTTMQVSNPFTLDWTASDAAISDDHNMDL